MEEYSYLGDLYRWQPFLKLVCAMAIGLLYPVYRCFFLIAFALRPKLRRWRPAPI
jgi:hypothetical protein